MAAEVGAACRDTGFFAITGHGISPAQMQDAFAVAHEVFALPAEAKQELAIARHGSNRGYVGLAIEALDEKTARDLKAVSYTHLDVYKRQVLTWVKPTSVAIRAAAFSCSV